MLREESEHEHDNKQRDCRVWSGGGGKIPSGRSEHSLFRTEKDRQEMQKTISGLQHP
jgi:hypothetical protein